METILMVLAGFGAGSVILSLVSFWLIHGILTRQKQRDTERESLCHRERIDLSGRMAAAESLHREEVGKLNQRLADQEVYHQTERRELYERIQQAQVYTEPLLTGRVESGTPNGRSAAVDPDDMSPEDLAKIGVMPNSDGGFIDLRSKDKDLFETVKGLLFFREEAEKKKKELAES